MHGSTPPHSGARRRHALLHPAGRGQARRRPTRAGGTNRVVGRRARRAGDFVADVACHLPLQAIAGLMGFPDEDRERLIHWSDQMAATEDPEYGTMSQTATFELLAYAYSSAEERKARDLGDVTSRLVRPDASGQTLSSEEYGFFFIILAVAGNETTRQAIAHGMLAFLEHPDQWEHWRAERPSTAVDEILRYASPAVVLQRTATEDTEVDGRPIHRGERVGMYFASANFDEDVYNGSTTVRHRAKPEPARDVRRRRTALLHRSQPDQARGSDHVRCAGRRALRHRPAREDRADFGPRGSTASRRCPWRTGPGRPRDPGRPTTRRRRWRPRPGWPPARCRRPRRWRSGPSKSGRRGRTRCA